VPGHRSPAHAQEPSDFRVGVVAGFRPPGCGQVVGFSELTGLLEGGIRTVCCARCAARRSPRRCARRRNPAGARLMLSSVTVGGGLLATAVGDTLGAGYALTPPILGCRCGRDDRPEHLRARRVDQSHRDCARYRPACSLQRQPNRRLAPRRPRGPLGSTGTCPRTPSCRVSQRDPARLA